MINSENHNVNYEIIYKKDSHSIEVPDVQQLSMPSDSC
jgi:hypothetical protein